jgi:60 kDa SS-A/Ro ribonucleoprotein
MNTYSKNYSPRKKTSTPQTQPMAGKQQIKNSAGGYVFQANDWTRLDRFLILGTEGGTYYVNEKKLTIQNAEVVLRCLQEDGLRVVRTVVSVSTEGRAVKNDPALFALALAAAKGDDATRAAALAALPQVARIGTFLFTFLEMVEGLRGWGRGLRNAISKWYTDKKVSDLAYQLVKYRQRNGWTHRDAMRLAHPIAQNPVQKNLFQFAVKGEYTPQTSEDTRIVDGFMKIQETTDPKVAAELIRQYRLPREAVPTELLKSREVWEALSVDMPMTALIRNLGNLGKHGLLVPGNFDFIKQVTDQLGDVERVHKARVHPITILAALSTYESGKGVRGHGEWEVVPQVVDALDRAFYAAFKNVEPTGKKFMLGLDVSGSMSQEVSNIPGLSCAKAATAMALLAARTEEQYVICAFDTGFKKLPITAQMSLPQAMRYTENINYGGTNVAVPIEYALKNKIGVDVFCVYTDNETYAGSQHVVEALNQYRKMINPAAKMAVFSMVANEFTVADPDDLGMMDMIGFSADSPQALREFALL